MRKEKQFLVQSVGDAVAKADYVYFTSFLGLTVKEMSELRNQLAAANASCLVLKNSLIKKAGELIGIDNWDGVDLTSGTAMVFGKGDCSAVAKLLKEFGKKNDKLVSKGGYLDGATIAAAAVNELADLPPKAVLQAMLLGVLQAPSRNLVTVLNAKAASIVNVLSAYKDKVEKQ